MKNIQNEISRNVPKDIPIRFSENTIPLFTAYGCVLMERDTGASYIYTAVNLKTGGREVIARRQTPLTTSGVTAMAEKIRLSGVAGAGRLQADRPFGDGIAVENCRDMLTEIFNEILPQHRYTIRKEQISLARHILETIYTRSVSLAEAEVGTGKTLAYLISAVIAKRGRLNGYWNMSFCTGSPYIEMAHMPIVIATSSIALQKALVTEHIPILSGILLEHGIIQDPLTAVIRKGREHYICDRNLRTHIPFEHNHNIRKILEGLFKPNAVIDLAEIDGLTAHVKRKICVPDRCDTHCPHRDSCPYLRFREQAQSPEIDIQVCNHNYLLADALRRRDNKRPLIPNYQCIVIDEAHKFIQAVRSMYGAELSSLSLPDIKDIADSLNLKHDDTQKFVRKTTGVLSDESKRLFRGLVEKTVVMNMEDEPDRFAAVIDDEAYRHIRNIRNISDELIERLSSEPLVGNGAGRRAQILWELEQVRNQAAMFARHDELICWLEKENNESRLCVIPKDLGEKLYDDIWSKGIPIILTSGTLSAASDFSRIKKVLGLERLGHRLTETSKPSPFDYRKNAILFISENTPFPDRRNREYILSIANEIERLIHAAHGHTAVLFTSYKAMDMVWELLEERGIPFPMYRLDKGGIREIDRFKQSGNGILFAAGALWEGIDIPGDALSMLIIVKLPFAVPDPIGEYEQSLYKDMDEYKRMVVTPEMLIKLKQGFGRLIRIETDTGVVAILDCRAGTDGMYRECILDALPKCRVTSDLLCVTDFIHEVKTKEYFK
ncbi:MAG: ATP-dependent DNA helicase [Oscillospiraceae bacterium]|nr:ATP-dependent DNA helicase [Oscillospiraceae bacterium]